MVQDLSSYSISGASCIRLHHSSMLRELAGGKNLSTYQHQKTLIGPGDKYTNLYMNSSKIVKFFFCNIEYGATI
jgi:hypothetical protein